MKEDTFQFFYRKEVFFIKSKAFYFIEYVFFFKVAILLY